MNRIISVIICIGCSYTAISQDTQPAISLIPEPVSLQRHPGNFTITKKTEIEITGNDPDVKRVAAFLSEKLSKPSGFRIPVRPATSSSPALGNIRLALAKNSSKNKEGYRMVVTSSSLVISGSTAAGLFYGVQSLYQLLPKEIEGRSIAPHVTWKVPALTIEDHPRFGWRGLMLDVSRHFFTKQEVEDFIDNMVKYKYNLLHLHLTDDQGWRIEIKSLPNLTAVGAWRAKREGAWGNTKAPDESEPRTYGGFYTQDDIKELVQYAADRFVSILPEIDVPAHSMAAVAAYPDLSCTPGKYQVNAGEEFQLWSDSGNVALIDNTLCPANEKVYEFLDKVFGEVATLFPFEYIHVGGDEAAKNFWAASAQVRSLMQKEGLKTMEEVQSYFVKRVEKIVQAKGKKLIGWDEILEGGLAPDATVMSWRGMKGGIEAAKQNHHVVMAPLDYTYVDLMQGDAYVEPPEFGTLLLDQSYKFDPVPAGIDSNFILGGEANLWSEHTTNMRAGQYLLWPRALAVAECVWTPKDRKNWIDFVRRTEHEFERMDVARIKYSRSMYDPSFSASLDNNNQLQVTLGKQLDDLDIYYSFDETNPDEFYPKYEKTLVVPKDALHLKVITYRNGRQVGRQINMPVEELRKRVKKPK